jgi:chromate transporter
MHTRHDTAGPTAKTLLRIWAGIGLQSFGGGASTQLLIRREFVERRPWVGDEEMGRFWNLCQLTPGINLIALTILIGRKLGGTRGIVVSVAGLLVPSAVLTCCLAAGFEAVQHSPVLHAILRGVIPATAGIMGVVAFGFARPLIRRAQKESITSVCISAAFILMSALGLVIFKLPAAAVLVGAAVLGVMIFTPRGTPAATLTAPGPAQLDQPS